MEYSFQYLSFYSVAALHLDTAYKINLLYSSIRKIIITQTSKSTKGNKNKYGFLDERSNKEYIVTTNLTPIQRGI